jgi:1-deoxy-D-xylulose-5-phosphate synthase
MDQELRPLPLGKGELLREGEDLVIIALGSTVRSSLEAAERLAEEGFSAAVVNARFAKPLDEELLLRHARKTGRVMTVEEHALQGGFGSAVLELLDGARLSSIKTLRIGLPDQFIEHGSQAILRKKYGLDADGILSSARQFMAETSLKAVAPVAQIKAKDA